MFINDIPPSANTAIVVPYQIQPKVIYFDFGGVMAGPDSEVQLNYLVGKGFPQEAIAKSPYLRWMQLHDAEIAYLNAFGVPYSLEEYRDVKRNSVREIPGMSELVYALRRMNYEVNLITNIRPENLDLIEPYRAMFDHVVHCPKDPGERQVAWEMEWAQHGLMASDCLLIDDQLPNVNEAQNLGIQTIQFTNAAGLVEELAQRGFLNQP